MIESNDKLFGNLPQYPPNYQNQSYCSDCSQCAKQLALQNNTNIRLTQKHIDSSLFNHKNKKLNKHLCQVNPRQEQNINNQINKEIKRGRTAAQKIRTNLQFKDLGSEEFIKKEKRRYQYQLQKQGNDEKYNNILKKKSQKQFQQNHEKKSKSNKWKALDLKKMHQMQQQSAFMLLRQQKVQYLRKLHKLLFQLEKQKLIEEKKNFKSQLIKNATKAKKQLAALQHAHRNNVQELRDLLQQAKKERQINKIDQRKVLRQLQIQLKEDQQRLNKHYEYKIENQIQKTRTANREKFGEKAKSIKR